MSALSLNQRLQAARQQMEQFDSIRKEAFQPAPAMPQGGAPPMDPSMQQQGPPPMDPAMQQQAMMQQQGMDPAMMQQGPPPMDPAAQAPPLPPEQLEEMMMLLEQMGQGLQQAMERVAKLEGAVQQLGPQVEEVMSTLQSAMQQQPDEGQQRAAGGW